MLNRAMKVSCEYVPQYVSQSGEALGVLKQLLEEMSSDMWLQKVQNWSTRRRLMI